MSAADVIEQIKQLPTEDQKKVFVFLAGMVISRQGTELNPWLGKTLSFDDACDVIFRENRELLSLLVK